MAGTNKKGVKIWPFQSRVRGEIPESKVWVRFSGTQNLYHLPNMRGRRSLCTALLPTGDEREEREDPPVSRRCKTCQREVERRVPATKEVGDGPQPIR